MAGVVLDGLEGLFQPQPFHASMLPWAEPQRVWSSNPVGAPSCSALGKVTKVHFGSCLPRLCFVHILCSIPTEQFPEPGITLGILPLSLLRVPNTSTRSCGSNPGRMPAAGIVALPCHTSECSQGTSPEGTWEQHVWSQGVTSMDGAGITICIPQLVPPRGRGLHVLAQRSCSCPAHPRAASSRALPRARECVILAGRIPCAREAPAA